jgi:branched-chain amino acid transport system ATP-binding protein
MLRITDLHSFYGESHIMHGIDLRSGRGRGGHPARRNGSGRTTTLKSMMGLVGKAHGLDHVQRRELTVGMAPHQASRAWAWAMPGGARHLLLLTTEENLMLPPKVRSKAA